MLPKKMRVIPPKAPPIKTQGIKTKLVPLIESSVEWDGSGRWIEPFMGSASVALNVGPKKALLCDTNSHLIAFYKAVQSGEVNTNSVKKYLISEGAKLSEIGESHYYFIRDRFNATANSLDFLFLSRSCFNGMIRFNKHGKFNVPFCKKPNRFRKALITKIINQVDWAANVMRDREWEFKAQSWQKTLKEAKIGDLIYCDPPYVGRHTTYYNSFDDCDADELALALVSSQKKFVFSNWLENKYRRNEYVKKYFSDYTWSEVTHFYHVGASKSLRNRMREVVISTP